MGLGPKTSYSGCVVAEYVWIDAFGVPRSKTKTLEIPCNFRELNG